MDKILENIDGTIQRLWDKGEISLNLKHYLEEDIQNKATALLNALCNSDLESLSGDQIGDLIYEHIGDYDAR